MLTFVPTPIGNLEDITIRALRTLEKAQIVFCEDTRVARRLFALLQERHGMASSDPKFVALHSHNEKEVLADLDPESLTEKEAVYISDAGMPAISDPGAELAAWCRRNSVPYTVLPGPTAFATAYAASGFGDPRFIFYGFLPPKEKAREAVLTELVNERYPIILYEAPHRLTKLLESLEKIAPERRIFAAKELTKKHERYFEGVPGELKEKITGSLIKGEWVVILDKNEGSEEDLSERIAEIEAMDLPPKKKAKMLAKLTGRSVTEWYDRLTARNA